MKTYYPIVILFLSALFFSTACDELEDMPLEDVAINAAYPGCGADDWQTLCTFACEYGGYEVQIRQENGGSVYYDVEPWGHYDWENEESVSSYFYVPQSAYNDYDYNWWEVTALYGVDTDDCLCGNTGMLLTGTMYQIEIDIPDE